MADNTSMRSEQSMEERNASRNPPLFSSCFALDAFGPADPFSVIVRDFFRTIATEQSWQPGNDLNATSPYAEFARFFVALRSGDSGEENGTPEIAGALYLVRGNSTNTLPTRSVWPEIDFGGRTDIADVFLLALAPKFRGGGLGLVRVGDSDGGNRISGDGPIKALPVFWQLCVGMWQWCHVEGIHELCGIATPRSTLLYRRLGWPLSIVGPERSHWGEPCVPFLLSVSAVHAEITRRAARGSQSYRQIMEAAGRTEEGTV